MTKNNKKSWAAFGVIYFFAALIIVFARLFDSPPGNKDMTASVLIGLVIAFFAAIMFILGAALIVRFLRWAFSD